MSIFGTEKALKLLTGLLVGMSPGLAFADDGADTAVETAPDDTETSDDERHRDAPPVEPKLEILPGAMNRSIGIPVRRGFWFGTADRRFSLRMTGFAHLDFRLPVDLDSGKDAGFAFVRRGRLAVEGNVFGNLEWRALIDAAIGLLPIDLFLDWRLMPEFNVRIGRFKSPFGFERRMRAYAILFNERAFPTSLAPNRDVGVFVHGQTREGFLSWDVAALAGAADLESIEWLRGPPEFAGRLYVQPFRLLDVPELKHLGLGFSWTVGTERGSADDPRLGRVQTIGRETIFRYRGGASDVAAFADGARDRWSLHAHWRHERYFALFEMVRSNQRVRSGQASRRMTHDAWQVAFSAMLTDDEHGFFGVKPKRPFNPVADAWGAASLSLRYHELWMDKGVADFADAAFAVQQARGVSLSGQWHINDLLEMQLDTDVTAWTAGLPGATNTRAEFALSLRLEARY